MGDLQQFYLVELLILALYGLNKLIMLIRFKKSGKVIYEVQYKMDPIYVIVWALIAIVFWIPILIDAIHGKSIANYRIINGVLWVVIMVIVAIIQSNKPIITEGGIYTSASFYKWSNVRDLEWEKAIDKCLVLHIDARFLFIKYPTMLRWRIESSQKIKVENIIKAHLLK